MKKLFMVMLFIMAMFTLAGCMNEEDYYTNTEVNALVSGLNEQIEALQPTQSQRYLDALIGNFFLDGSMQFAEIGDRVQGVVESRSYAYIIVELEVDTLVEISVVVSAPDDPYETWDLNVYWGAYMEEADFNFESIEEGDTFRVTLHAGWNTIELDSYAYATYIYIIDIDAI